MMVGDAGGEEEKNRLIAHRTNTGYRGCVGTAIRFENNMMANKELWVSLHVICRGVEIESSLRIFDNTW